jgi:hypothetical protein
VYRDFRRHSKIKFSHVLVIWVILISEKFFNTDVTEEVD